MELLLIFLYVLFVLIIKDIIWGQSYIIDQFVDYTDGSILDTLRKMLRDIDHLFNENGIVYMIDGGTLLGAVRHNDIIPWDDDADIVIMNDDGNAELKLLSLTIQLRSMGYGLSKFWGGYRIYRLNGDDIKDDNRNWKWNNDDIERTDKYSTKHKYPFVDIFFMEREGNVYTFSCRNVRSVWPNFYHMITDVYPLKQYKFNDFFLFGPNNPEPYLARAYGDDWKTVAYKSYDHKTQTMISQEKFPIVNVF